MNPLADYAVDPSRGFVPAEDPLAAMPAPFAAWESVAQDLSGLVRMRRVRRAIRSLPPIDLALAATTAERERLFLTLSVLTNAWVWGDGAPDLRIPAHLAVPVSQLAAMLGRKPLVSHASMTLQNWRRIDPSEPVSADNSALLVGVLGGVDETWFFTSTLGVELVGAPLIAASFDAVNAAGRDDVGGLTEALTRLADGLPAVVVALDRMREWCDPHVFYHRVRPYLAGWPAPGAVYEGVSEEPNMLAGGSAGQSSLIQTFDAALGVRHEGKAAAFLSDMRNYMPTLHRQFVVDLAAKSRVRALVQRVGQPSLVEAYDAAVSHLDVFRRRHIGLSVDYILKPSGQSASIGTGGTHFVDLLREARVGTARSVVGGDVEP